VVLALVALIEEQFEDVDVRFRPFAGLVADVELFGERFSVSLQPLPLLQAVLAFNFIHSAAVSVGGRSSGGLSVQRPSELQLIAERQRLCEGLEAICLPEVKVRFPLIVYFGVLH